MPREHEAELRTDPESPTFKTPTCSASARKIWDKIERMKHYVTESNTSRFITGLSYLLNGTGPLKRFSIAQITTSPRGLWPRNLTGCAQLEIRSDEMGFASRPKSPEIPEITITPPDEIWAKQSAPAPYISFGDQGLTASVGTYGSLLRICCPVQKLEYKNSSDPDLDDRTSCDIFQSKIVCLEYSGEKAWFVTYRSAQFLRDAENADSGFGLRLGDGIHPLQSNVKFVGSRWPVIRYGTKEGFLVTTRLWCQDGVIVQRMCVDRASGPEEINMNLNLRLFMQDLDYIMPSDNKKIREYQSNTPENGHRILLMGNEEGKSQIGVLVELFKDEQAHTIPDFPENRQSRRAEEVPEPGDSLWSIPFTHKFEGQQTHVEYTLTLKMQMASSHLALKLLEVPSLPNRRSPFEFGKESKAGPFTDDIEAKVNWHCYRNLEHILSVCSIPLYSSLSKVSETLKTTGTGYSCPSTSIALTCGDFGDHRVSVSGS
ncbi:hypothetical protein N7493_001846 [Penicillium malachiteum]|uniref:Uncharacterized protein n=1 Tax=Penicillium malachiteum TaxID=1324776 RepID=A0AAD6N0Q6_9EURO|nr:hypothetical protein N7493_001846 [Penicillium malachiteum]